MNKYINGQIVKMTEKDIAHRNEIIQRHNSRRSRASDDARIKELEQTVTYLSARLNDSTAVETE